MASDDWDEKRIDVIGSNGNDALHYQELENNMMTTAVNSEQGYINRVDSLINNTYLTLTEAIANVNYEYAARGWPKYSYYGKTEK